jgi:hypothetical protein
MMEQMLSKILKLKYIYMYINLIFRYIAYLETINLVFTIIFIVETILKLYVYKLIR